MRRLVRRLNGYGALLAIGFLISLLVTVFFFWLQTWVPVAVCVNNVEAQSTPSKDMSGILNADNSDSRKLTTTIKVPMRKILSDFIKSLTESTSSSFSHQNVTAVTRLCRWLGQSYEGNDYNGDQDLKEDHDDLDYRQLAEWFVPVRYRKLKLVTTASTYADMCTFFCQVNASRATGGEYPPPISIHIYTKLNEPCLTDMPDIPASYGRAFNGMHMTDVLVPLRFRQSPYHATDPFLADLYWIPYHGDPHLHDWTPSLHNLIKRLECLQEQSVLFKRHGGSDHMASIPSDYGPCKVNKWYMPPENELIHPLLGQISLAVFNGELGSTCFSSEKDVVLPPQVPFSFYDWSQCVFDGHVAGEAAANRGYYKAAECRAQSVSEPAPSTQTIFKRLAFFSGRICWHGDPNCDWYSRGIRQRLFQLTNPAEAEPAMAVEAALTRWPKLNRKPLPIWSSGNLSAGDPDPQKFILMTSQKFNTLDFLEHLQSSEFCLAPAGYALWSPRPMEAMWAGCIPVILAEGLQLPFADVIDWRRLAVWLRNEDVNDLVPLLQAIPVTTRQRMRTRIRAVHHIFRVLTGRYEYGEDGIDMLAFQLWRRKHRPNSVGLGRHLPD